MEEGKPCKTEQVYSASTLFSLSQCSWRYFLEFEEEVIPEVRRPQAVRGSALHKTIHRLHRDQAWKHWLDVWQEERKRAILEDAEIPWADNVKEEKIETLFSDGGTILGNYVEQHQRAKVLASEVSFYMLLQHPRTGTRYRFTGTIDQVREGDIVMHNQTPGIYVPSDGEGLEVWDIKSDADSPDQAYLDRNIQFSSYGLGMRHGLFEMADGLQPIGVYPNRAVWYHLQNLLPYKRAGTVPSTGRKYFKGDLRGDPEIQVDRTPEDYEQFQVEACQMIRMIRMRMFFRSVTKIGCSMCSVKHACTSGRYMKATDLIDAGDLSDL